MERHGYRSAQAERLRGEYQARVQARGARAAAVDAGAGKPPSLDDIRRQAREDWLRMRRESAAPLAPAQARNPDDDLSR
jgi:DNA-nicking Smr family endonuclease